MNPMILPLIKVAIAFIAGALLGIEREYRSEPAGFTTMILICVGSTVFTILSASFVDNGDRIASNIISGVGFLGAGVIFKEGLTVRGITSAATIWMAAAIGMSIGLGFYAMAALIFCWSCLH
jgi:putative Mg2+ transporter-C (MgtC) family protein